MAGYRSGFAYVEWETDGLGCCNCGRPLREVGDGFGVGHEIWEGDLGGGRCCRSQ